jgi:hypothetical protein
MPECAFCPNTAKLTGEHIWSEWIGRLFTGRKFHFHRYGDNNEEIGSWSDFKIDMTAKVVCASCNNGWMSHLEQHHAMPAMAELIRGKGEFKISPSRAQAIARFAFKTAVIVDHMTAGEPFHARSARHHFAKSLKIPRDVRMWLCGYLPVGSGRVHAQYHSGEVDSNRSVELYVCTYAVGHLVFQAVSVYSVGIHTFECQSGFEHLAAPLWPVMPDSGIEWPPNNVLTRPAFVPFAERWRQIRLSKLLVV